MIKDIGQKEYPKHLTTHPNKHFEDPKSLPTSIIRKLGYSDDDVKLIFNKYSNTLEEFRHRSIVAPEMVVFTAKRTTIISFQDKYEFKMKSGKQYITDLVTFIDLYNKGKQVKATNIFKRNLKLYQGQDLTNKRLLCYAYGCGLGDALFMQPILRFIKEKYPSCELSFAVPKRHHNMIEDWDFVDKILPTPFSIIPFKTAHYHLTFDGIIGKCQEAEVTNIYYLLRRWVKLDIPDNQLTPVQRPKDELVEYCKKILNEWYMSDTPFAIVQLRADSIIRTPRDEFKIELLNALIDKDIMIIITDMPNKQGVVKNIINKTKNPDMIFNFCEYSKSIDITIALVSLAKLVVSVDTGLIHIAAACGIPTYGIYGPFTGNIRLSTYKHSYWIDAQADCAPCFIHGYKSCNKAKNKFPICFDSINIKSLADNINILWKEIIRKRA